MTKRYFKILLLFILFFWLRSSKAQDSLPIYKDSTQPVESRVEDLVKKMTPEEKFWQLFMIPIETDTIVDDDHFYHGIFGLQFGTNGEDNKQILDYQSNNAPENLAKKINAVQKYFIEESRLGIPIIPFDEAVHGLIRKNATMFPQSIGWAATFNPSLMGEVAQAISQETRLRGIRQVLSPVINLASDVRWGRTEETYGEDPLLTSRMGLEYVSAMEQNGIISTPKHFVANVGAGGRDSYPINWSKKYLRENHLIPFQKMIAKGNSKSIMTSYNLLNGRPTNSNEWLLKDVLKGDWGFKGFAISDASALGANEVLQFTAEDYKDAATQAINAGLDVIFQTDYNQYKLFLPPFLNGKISKKRIDDAVKRVLRAKFELGLFDDPYVSKEDIEQLKDIDYSPLAEESAVQSMVLLENQKQTLPIKEVNKLLVVGPDAKEKRFGGYSSKGKNAISLLEGIKQVAKQKDAEVEYEEGTSRNLETLKPVRNEFLKTSKNTSGVHAKYYSNYELQGSPALERHDENIAFKWTLNSPDQNKLDRDNYSVRWEGKLIPPQTDEFKIGLRGNDGFRLFIDDSLVINKWQNVSYSTKTVSLKLDKTKPVDIAVEFHEGRGNGNIELVWDYDVPDYEVAYARAMDKAKDSDFIVVTAGIEEGEFQDRSSLALPGNQEKFIKEVSKLNKPVVVVLIGGSAIKTTDWKDDVDAILDIWYPGERGGIALGRVLFGMENPSGKLPVTFPKEEGQLPLSYNHQPTGRGDDYNDLSGEPLYPFGYGKSYTTFKFSDLEINGNVFKENDTIAAKVSVKNTGPVEGREVVQLYYSPLLTPMAKPIIELKDFKKIHLMPGEKREVKLKVPVESFKYIDTNGKWKIDKEKGRLMIGNSSKNLPIKDKIRIN